MSIVWHYRIIEIGTGRNLDDSERKLNELGMLGWEVVAGFSSSTSVTGFVVLKRGEMR